MLQHFQFYLKASCLREKVQLRYREELNLFMDLLLLLFKRLIKKMPGTVNCSQKLFKDSLEYNINGFEIIFH